MFRRSALFILATVPLVLQSCVLTPKHKAVGTLAQSVEHVSDSAVSVNTKNGGVEVVADSGVSMVEISATITCVGESDQDAQDRLNQTTLSIVRAADDSLTITPRFPDKRSGDGASFVVRLPDARGVTIDTSNGSVTVKNLAGTIGVDTSNGRIVLSDHDGPATLETSNGSINVANLSGSLFADTSNASVSATNVEGPATIDTSNAGVTLALADDQGGPLNVDTSNGNINITVGQGFNGRVVFDTSNGVLKIVDPSGRINARNVDRNDGSIELGSAGDAERSVVDTSNGNITFTVGG